MLQISNKELVFVDGKFFERKSYIAVITAFRQRFNQAPPCKKTTQKTLQSSVYMDRVWIGTEKIPKDEGLLVLKKTLN